jgi:hypothetical protein
MLVAGFIICGDEGFFHFETELRRALDTEFVTPRLGRLVGVSLDQVVAVGIGVGGDEDECGG